jgi:DNA-binding MarR family transcriptional regulator
MGLKGELHPQHKLTEKQVRSIRRLWEIGHRNIKVLAKNNGVSTSNIRKIVKNETWKHILFGEFDKYR